VCSGPGVSLYTQSGYEGAEPGHAARLPIIVFWFMKLQHEQDFCSGLRVHEAALNLIEALARETRRKIFEFLVYY
jgi:hypothetical protein